MILRAEWKSLVVESKKNYLAEITNESLEKHWSVSITGAKVVRDVTLRNSQNRPILFRNSSTPQTIDQHQNDLSAPQTMLFLMAVATASETL
jgi:hypothetical protein